MCVCVRNRIRVTKKRSNSNAGSRVLLALFSFIFRLLVYFLEPREGCSPRSSSYLTSELLSSPESKRICFLASFRLCLKHWLLWNISKVLQNTWQAETLSKKKAIKPRNQLLIYYILRISVESQWAHRHSWLLSKPVRPFYMEIQSH